MSGRATVTVHVLDSFYLLVPFDPDNYDVRSVGEGGNGVIAVQDGGMAMIGTGTDTGPVLVTGERLADQPAVDLGNWDEIVDVAVRTSGRLLVCDSEMAPTGLELTEGPGDYRLRVHVRGRDAAAAAGIVLSDPVEEHLLLTWPAPAQPEQVHKATDEFGRLVYHRPHHDPSTS